MKPQNLKDTASHSSQMQEGNQSENVAFSPEQLKDIIAGLETDIVDGNWMNADYASTDLKMMPALVEQANLKYPGMNLSFAMTAHEFADSMKKAIDDGVQSSRCIINIKDGGIHFAVIDHRTIDDQTSVVFFEPTTLKSMQPAMLALRTQSAVKSHQVPNCHFAIVEMDIQRSASECGMFSLALAKKLYTESSKLERMHRDNISGVLCERGTPLPYDKLDHYLPPSFYKHTQGTRRLKEYVKSNPSAESEKVNKKGETLFQRFDKNSVKAEDKNVSVSSHKKRIIEYKSVLKL
ncbi:YopJ/AvrA family T3SS effector serine/threonine acetyltransferase [Bartonella sp. B12(2025)]